jgi:hypothetical protein
VALSRATGPAEAKEAVRSARNARVKGAMKERLSMTRRFEGVELQAQKSIADREKDELGAKWHVWSFNRDRIQRSQTQNGAEQKIARAWATVAVVGKIKDIAE